jgi:hypothetical protein
VRGYVTTSRHERANPKPEVATAVAAPAEVAAAIAGRWVGRPRIATIDVDIELTFARNPDGTVQGALVGTNLGRIGKPLRALSFEGRVVRFELPNIQPWSFAGEVGSDGTITGIVSSAQGGLPVTFRRAR